MDRVAKVGPWTLGISEGADPAFFNEEFEWPETVMSRPGDRPSRVRLDLEQSAHARQQAQVTLRPIAERWESPANAMRWQVKLRSDRQTETALQRNLDFVNNNAKPLATGFALGALLAAATMWRLIRRRR